jgi:hypothetical protein
MTLCIVVCVLHFQKCTWLCGAISGRVWVQTTKVIYTSSAGGINQTHDATNLITTYTERHQIPNQYNYEKLQSLKHTTGQM